MIPPARSLTVVPTGEVMRSTSVWVVLFTVDGTLKPTVGIKTREDVDGREVEGSVCTTVACASSAEARTTSSFFSVSSAEESTSVSDDFFAR
jgi:hypothetical protein